MCAKLTLLAIRLSFFEAQRQLIVYSVIFCNIICIMCVQLGVGGIRGAIRHSTFLARPF